MRASLCKQAPASPCRGRSADEGLPRTVSICDMCQLVAPKHLTAMLCHVKLPATHSESKVVELLTCLLRRLRESNNGNHLERARRRNLLPRIGSLQSPPPLALQTLIIAARRILLACSGNLRSTRDLPLQTSIVARSTPTLPSRLMFYLFANSHRAGILDRIFSRLIRTTDSGPSRQIVRPEAEKIQPPPVMNLWRSYTTSDEILPFPH